MKIRFDVTNDAGKEFAVVLLMSGAKYGLNDCLTMDDESGPVVEFHELIPETCGSIEGTKLNFISRYFLDTLKESWGERARDVTGICLDGGVPEWSIDAETMQYIVSLCNETVFNLTTKALFSKGAAA